MMVDVVLLALGTRRGFVGRSSLPPPASGESTSLNLDRWTTLFPPSIPLTNYRLVEHGNVLLIVFFVSLIMYISRNQSSTDIE